MGRTGGKYKETNDVVKKKSLHMAADDGDMMNDEIDAFHKNRDVVPLNINKDMEESDGDYEQPVFDLENDEDEDEDDEDEDIDSDHDRPPKGLAAKIVRTQKYLQAKFGGIEDEDLDDADEEEQERIVWGRKKEMYGADVDYEPQSSDDEDAAEEEAEVLRLEREKAKTLTLADFGLEDPDQDVTDQEPTFEELHYHEKPTSQASIEKGVSCEDGMAIEVIKKDLNALTKEEQMDVVYSSAPELVGLLSELHDAVEQLENKVNPFVEKIGECEDANGGMHFMKIKQLLLLSYCQAITFYLLLKSEGNPVRDHPVIPRLIEIKSLLDKVKEIEKNLPFSLDDIVKKVVIDKTVVKSVGRSDLIESNPLTSNQILPAPPAVKPVVEPNKAAEPITLRGSKDTKEGRNDQDKQIGLQSIQMLKIRESLDEKLRQKGVFSSIRRKSVRNRSHLQTANRQLETFDDFVDETMEIDGLVNGTRNGNAQRSNSSKLYQHLTLRTRKRKVVSGDDDIPKRDDIGERRRKHELRVLARAGIRSTEYGDNVEDEAGNLPSGKVENVDEDESDTDSDLEYYKQVKQQHTAKLAAKAKKYSRTPQVPSLPETVDGRRPITHEMMENRGLTRYRKKLIKNPRNKYKLKHKKAEIRRKGQVREIRKPSGPYGGEPTGINDSISRSIRFKS